MFTSKLNKCSKLEHWHTKPVPIIKIPPSLDAASYSWTVACVCGLTQVKIFFACGRVIPLKVVRVSARGYIMLSRSKGAGGWFQSLDILLSVLGMIKLLSIKNMFLV